MGNRHKATEDGDDMRIPMYVSAALIAAMTVGAGMPSARAQVSISLGVAPECPYGYYDAAHYDCAPSGYYGPEWFNGGGGVGGGPWFHGPAQFRGRVNNAFHPDHGYKGAMPARGEKARPQMRVDKAHFHGNEERDGRGHASAQKH